jgi:glycosyltransferase involved in cell wall biosynthesis
VRQTYKIDEILVVDDGSTDSTMAIAGDYPVRVISHNRNKGLAAARNTAFRESRNEFVAALDADCAASAEWLAELMRCFTEGDVSGIAGRLLEKNTSGLADKWRARHMKQSWGEDILYDPPFLYGNNSVFRKSAVIKAGLYNEGFKTNYEDIDLSERIYKCGLRMAYNPLAVVGHLRQDKVISVLRSFWVRQCYYRKYNELREKGILREIAMRIGGLSDYVDISEIFFREDYANDDYGLLAVDSWLVFYCFWEDMKYLFKRFYSPGALPYD